jgi:hypothetical protein
VNAAAILQEHRQALLTAIEAGEVPQLLRIALRIHLEKTLDAWAGRAEASRQRNAARSAAIRARIRAAAAKLPLEGREMSELVRVARCRLGTNPPADSTIEHELTRMLAEKKVLTPELGSSRSCVRVPQSD